MSEGGACGDVAGGFRPRAFRPGGQPKPPTLSRFLQDWAARGSDLDREIDFEIGSGVGFRAIQQARSEPDRILIAVEKTKEKFEKFYARVGRTEQKGTRLPGLFPVHADAVSFAVHALGPGSLSRVLIYYPNPEPQNPAARWFRMPFFGYLLEKLKAGGSVVLRTNRESYAREARYCASEFWSLEILVDRTFDRAQVDPREGVTHFERKYLERGETCYELIFRRRN